jgi:hypothetical protein
MTTQPRPCEHFTAGAGVCGAPTTRRYLSGWNCPRHTPAALRDRPEVVPDPAATLDGLWRAAGKTGPRPPAPLGTSTLNDDRAIRSGKRRSSPARYREAQSRKKN